MWQQKENPALAKSFYRRALEINPHGIASIWNNLGVLASEEKGLGGGVALLRGNPSRAGAGRGEDLLPPGACLRGAGPVGPGPKRNVQEALRILHPGQKEFASTWRRRSKAGR